MDPLKQKKKKRSRSDDAPAAADADDGPAAAEPISAEARAARKERKKQKRALAAAAAAAHGNEDEDDGGGDLDDDGGAAAAAPAAADDLAREVYVEGLPYDASEAEVRAFFDGCGTIAALRAPTYQDSGRLRGYAHVEFASRAGAVAALARDGRYIRDRFINVQPPRSASEGRHAALVLSTRPRPAGCSTLFVKGLPYGAEDEAVRAAFRAFGAVSSVRLARWSHTGRLKGYGYVQFDVPFSADAAMKAYREGTAAGRPLRVGDRPVHLDWETSAPRASYKTATGQSFFKSDEAEAVRKAVQKAKLKGADRDEKREARKAKAAAAAAAAAAGDDAAAATGGGGRPPPARPRRPAAPSQQRDSEAGQ